MPIRTLVVDDSAFMRRIISDILSKDPDIQVVDTARDGEDAIKKAFAIDPDVITLDIEMPRMDGLTALAYIMTKKPMPVVMVSAYTKKNADETIKALGYGAIDFVTKPSGTISLDMEIVSDELIRKVKAAAQANVKKVPMLTSRDHIDVDRHFKEGETVVVIGASTGGPQAIVQVISTLPKNIPASIIVVQHMPAGFTRSFSERLEMLSQVAVKEARDGDVLTPGHVLVAPGDYHMRVHDGMIKLEQTERLHGVRPAIDHTMTDIAAIYGPKTIGVILTGMGKDGAAGLKLIKERGGRTIAQDEDTSIVYGMPKFAVEYGAADHVLPLNHISAKILDLLETGAS